jgi:pimeloyl-ACP methyl ester carboxylesterase
LSIIIIAALLIAGLIGFTRSAPQAATRLGLALERRRLGLSLKLGHVPGFTIPYLEGGKGEVLVLVHGFGGDKDNFARVAGHLNRRFRVILPDLAGFGDATRDPAARYRIADQVERLHALLHSIGVTRCRLGGNSMGGFIATQYAATYPDEVISLWLIDPAGTAAAYDNDMMRHMTETGESPLLLRSVEDADALIRATMARPPFLPGFVRKALALRGVADYPLHTRIMEELRVNSPLLETQFTSLATPALIVWGSEDKVLNPSATVAMQRLLPNSRVIMMPGLGHVPMLEDPAWCAKDFLAHVDAS